MYAVFKSNGKQYFAENKKIIFIDKINVEKNIIIEFKEIILLYKDKELFIGTPNLISNKVTAIVLDHIRDKKVKIVKFKRRKNYLKIKNHRQWFTKIQICNII